MRWAYEEIAAGIYNTEQVYQAARKKGLKVARSNFWVTIRNPLYCGKIFVPQFKDEASCLVPGKHEPIVSEALYYDVQDILDGRRKKLRIKPLNNAIFLLRGFLVCPYCAKILTGSSSKGRHQYYPYYHCTGTCTSRFRADRVNQLFAQELKKYIPRPEMKDLFHKAFLEAYNNQSKDQLNDKKHFSAQIKDREGKLAKAREVHLSRDIDPMDYKTMKSECEEKVNRLQVKLEELISATEDSSTMLKKGLDNLFGLGKIYENGDIAVKRRVIGSMYPEKLSFDGKNLRTARINEALRVIYTLDKGFHEIKNRGSDEFSRHSREVVLTGLPPCPFWDFLNSQLNIEYGKTGHDTISRCIMKNQRNKTDLPTKLPTEFILS